MNVLFCRLLGTAKVPIMDLKRGGPQSKDVNTCLFDGSGQPLPSVRIRFSLGSIDFDVVVFFSYKKTE